MLVAVGILGIVVAGVMETFVVQNRAYSVVDETTEAQQNLRAISYLIERDLRSTGVMVDEAGAVCGIDHTNAPDTLYVTDPDPINPTGAASSTLGAAVMGGYTASISEKVLQLDSVVIDPDSPAPRAFFDTDDNGIRDADFQIGRGAILFNTAGGGTACGVVTDVRPASNEVRVAFQNAIPVAGSLVLVPATVYTVNPDADVDGDGAGDGVSVLLRNGLALANDVEDFQVAYFFDSDEDGQEAADGSENFGNAGGNDYVAAARNHADLREIRFNIVVRSRNTDVTYQQGFQQATENRPAVGANDGFRRRVFTSTVRQRNIGYRGVQAAG
jgi:hypothetical protein